MKTRSVLIALCSFAALAPIALALMSESACAPTAAPPIGAGHAAAAPASNGIDLAGIDRSVAPGDDFFRYANGTWLKTTEIPADRSSWGVSGTLAELTARRTADLITEASKAEAPAGSDARKIGDTYATFMDEAAIEAKGLAPLQPALDRIAAIARQGGPRPRARRDAPRRRRRPEQHELLHAQRPRPLGRAGPRRPRPLLALPAAGRPRNARPRLLPRCVAAHGGDPDKVSWRTSRNVLTLAGIAGCRREGGADLRAREDRSRRRTRGARIRKTS